MLLTTNAVVVQPNSVQAASRKVSTGGKHARLASKFKVKNARLSAPKVPETPAGLDARKTSTPARVLILPACLIRISPLVSSVTLSARLCLIPPLESRRRALVLSAGELALQVKKNAWAPFASMRVRSAT